MDKVKFLEDEYVKKICLEILKTPDDFINFFSILGITLLEETEHPLSEDEELHIRLRDLIETAKQKASGCGDCDGCKDDCENNENN